MLHAFRLQGVKEIPWLHPVLIRAQEDRALTETASKIGRDYADLAHRRFSGDNEIAFRRRGTPSTLGEVRFVGIAELSEIEASVTNVLIAKDDHPAVSPNRGGVRTVDDGLAELGESSFTRHTQAPSGWRQSPPRASGRMSAVPERLAIPRSLNPLRLLERRREVVRDFRSSAHRGSAPSFRMARYA